MSTQQSIFPINLKIEDIIVETPQAKTFKLSAAKHLEYLPGQYLSFITQANNNQVRSYSLSSIPSEPFLSITVKRQDNGLMSRMLVDHAQPGDILTAVSLGGKFLLPEEAITAKDDYVFFAAGSGIVPIFSLIKALLSRSIKPKVTLIYSNSSIASTIFYNALENLRLQYPQHFSIKYFFSDAAHILDARLSAFQIENLVLKYIQGSIQSAHFYICGPIDYMDTVRITLLTHGALKEHVYTEEYFFYTEDLENVLEPPEDQQAYDVTILDKQITLKVQYPTSILDAALAQDIILPHSCHSGQCGNCVAKIISGKVWMSYNSVLTKSEMDAGLTLTCLGYPIEGPVTITYSDI